MTVDIIGAPEGRPTTAEVAAIVAALTVLQPAPPASVVPAPRSSRWRAAARAYADYDA